MLNFSGRNYVVDSFTISGTNGYMATYNFGKYFSTYDQFLKNSIVMLAGFRLNGGTDSGSGYYVYNGQAHSSLCARVNQSGTTVSVWHYQQGAVGNIMNVILIFT